MQTKQMAKGYACSLSHTTVLCSADCVRRRFLFIVAADASQGTVSECWSMCKNSGNKGNERLGQTKGRTVMRRTNRYAKDLGGVR